MLQKILNECEVRYNGELISREPLLKDFAVRMSELSLGKGHKVGVMLHTGSIAFSVMSFVTAAVLCIIEDFRSTEDIVNGLTVGDIVIFNKQRAEFKGKVYMRGRDFCPIDGNFREGMLAYYQFCTKIESSTNEYVPCNKINEKRITPYFGTATKLGGIGVKKKAYADRMAFIKYLWAAQDDDISPLITKSFIFVIDKDTANSIYDNTTITFPGGKADPYKANLSSIITASYFTEERDYICGSNPGKEQPTLMLFSKIEDARTKLIEDSSGDKRVLGLVVVGDEYLKSGSGITSLFSRKSTSAAYFSGKLDYSYTYEDFTGAAAEYWTLTPQNASRYNGKISEAKGKLLKELKVGISALAASPIKRIVLSSAIDSEKYRQIRRSLITLRNNYMETADFIAKSFSLLNLFLGAIFPLDAMEKVLATGKIPRVDTLQSKLDALLKSSSTLYGNAGAEAQTVVRLMHDLSNVLKSENSKGNYLLGLMKSAKFPDVLVVPKAYFAIVFCDWALRKATTSFERTALQALKIKTIGEVRSTGEMFGSVVYSGANFGEVNPQTLIVAENRSSLLYDCEVSRVAWQEKTFAGHRHEMLVGFGEESADAEEEIISTVLTSDETEEMEINSAINVIMSDNVKRYASHAANDYDSAQLSDVARIATFSGGDLVAYFTKHADVYRLSDGAIFDVRAEDIAPGDTLLFSNTNESRDLFGVIMDKLIEESEDARKQYQQSYALSKIWRLKLKIYLIEHGGVDSFERLLSARGIVRDAVTIRQWADENSHIIGPRATEAADIFRAIGGILSDEDIVRESQLIADACKEIRSLRGRVLDAIKQAVINKHSGGAIDPLFEPVMNKVDSLATLVQVEQITEYICQMPSHLTNRPIEVA